MFRYTGLNYLFFKINRGRKRIITYHNILPDKIYNEKLINGVSHQQSAFESQLAYIAMHFSVGTDLDNPKELTITFDDGYLNQHAIAYPILAKFQLPAVFFCTLDLIRFNQVPLLVDDLLFWLSFVDSNVYEIRWPGTSMLKRLDLRTDAERANCWQEIYGNLVANNFTHVQNLRDEFDRCVAFAIVSKKVDTTYYSLRCNPIPETALAELRSAGCLVGAHAVSHVPMTSMSDTALEKDVKVCSEQIGILFNTRVFSYPFGGLSEVGEREIACVKRNGFTHGVANINHPVDGGRRYGRYFIPRMALPNTTCQAEIAFVLSGAKYFLKYRRLLPRW